MSKNSWLDRNSNFRSILKNKTVLYLVFVAALFNLYMFVSNQDWMFAAIFILVGYLTCFFSQNMIVILCIAMATSNILKYGTKVRVRDGFTSEETSEPTDSISYLDESEPETPTITQPTKKTTKTNPSIEKTQADLQKSIDESEKSELDEDTKVNIKGLLETQMKLLLGVSELQPLLESSKAIMKDIQSKIDSVGQK